jgi:hypothetical protein
MHPHGEVMMQAHLSDLLIYIEHTLCSQELLRASYSHMDYFTNNTMDALCFWLPSSYIASVI